MVKSDRVKSEKNVEEQELYDTEYQVKNKKEKEKKSKDGEDNKDKKEKKSKDDEDNKDKKIKKNKKKNKDDDEDEEEKKVQKKKKEEYSEDDEEDKKIKKVKNKKKEEYSDDEDKDKKVKKVKNKKKEEYSDDEDDNKDYDINVQLCGDSSMTIGRKVRGIPTKDTIILTIDTLIEKINEEIVLQKEGKSTTKTTTFLGNIMKEIKILRTQSCRVLKIKNTRQTKNNINTGFQKPIKISKELADFTGWDDDSKRSRVEVTRYICDYIKKNNLQNPEDRRKIIPDKKLEKLLGHKKSNGPLTYYNIQTCLKNQNHFPIEK